MLESASKLQSIKQKQKAPFTDERLGVYYKYNL